MEVADRILGDARDTMEVLAADRQALWSALRSSINQRFDYWCQMVHPTLTRPVAAYLDQQLWQVFEAAVGFPVPRRGQVAGETDCNLGVPVAEVEDRPFAEWVARQPVQLHGAGFRSQEDRCFPAFIGALEQAAPFMAAQHVLEEVFGGEEAWGEDSDAGTRWATLLSTTHRDGRELKLAWAALQREAMDSALFLGEQLEGALARNVVGAGSDILGGSRQYLTEQREKTRGRLLLAAPVRHPQKDARPVWSWKERDKLSSAWLLCLPTPQSSFSSSQFSEAFAALLCQPSSSNQPRPRLQ